MFDGFVRRFTQINTDFFLIVLFTPSQCITQLDD
jgi:hypothetical protein